MIKKHLPLILLSIGLQILFFICIPTLVRTLPFMGTNFIRSWDAVQDHKIFRSQAKQKAVLLGASYLGERYCVDAPSLPGSIENDACLAANIFNLNRSKYFKMRDVEFFQVTMGGTVPQVHLYNLFQLLKINDGSLKYIIYDGPRKFNFATYDQDYHALHRALLQELENAPNDLRSLKIDKFQAQLKAEIDSLERSGEPYTKNISLHMFGKYLKRQRSWFGEFQNDLRSALNPDLDRVTFESFLQKHNKIDGGKDEDEFDPSKKISFPPSAYIETENDFLFLDILSEICRVRGIKLIIYYPPSRSYYSWAERDPYESHAHRPAMERLRPKGVAFFDYRPLPFLQPRDTYEGIHPTLSKRLEMVNRILADMEALNGKN